MNQDTRKDRRVKIVSLNVRYKSATVDEFIENHAHDVSRGGIYIKTANPFPPGTLLKFEIRLASDQAVIAGVGRVVWKREAGTPGGDRPAGMGVKFIKIDEPSKTVIDKLVNTKTDAGKAFESESEMPTALVEAPAAKAVPTAGATKLTPPPGAAGPMPHRKATMMGLGTPSSPPPGEAPAKAGESKPATAHAAPPRPAGSGGMFPSTHSEAEMPPKQEQTVMKQAAELLEEALREAGGSMEEIGTNPLFSGSASPPVVAAEAKAKSDPPAPSDRKTAPAPEAEAKGRSAGEAAKASTPAGDGKTPSARPAAKSREEDEAARARAMVAGMSPAPKRSVSEPPRTTRESPSAKSVPAADQPAAKKSGGGAFILLFVVVAAAAGAVVLFRDQLFGGGQATTSTSTGAATTAPTVPATAGTATAAPTESAAASASVGPAESASAAPSASAAATASATAIPAATVKPTAAVTTTAAPPAAVRPTVTAAPKPAATAPTAAEAPAATATATATATAAPATATPATAAATTTAAPKPKPAPKPKAADDNPY